MAVTSEPTGGRAGLAPPLNRQHLDNARRPARVLMGAAFVAYSSIGTVLGVQSDLAPALAGREDAATLGYAIGFGVALFIFIAELLLAEASVFWYSVILVPDAWYTYRFSGWVGSLIRVYVHGDPFVITMVVVFATGLFSLAVAYFGERMLFGRRR